MGTRKALEAPSLPKMSEAAFQKQTEAMLRVLGWVVFHERVGKTVRRSGETYVSRLGAGFLDVFAYHPTSGSVLLWELKAEKGRVTPEQEQQVRALARNPGVSCRVWRPHEWDTMVATARELARVPVWERA